MRSALVLVVAVVALAAGPVFAGEGSVPQSTLASLGLGDMQVLTDAEGLDVRGSSASAESSGLLLVVGLLFDPITGSNDTGSLSLFSRATAENAGLQQATDSSALIDDGVGGLAGIQSSLTTTLNGNPAFDGTFTIGGIGFTFAFGQ